MLANELRRLAFFAKPQVFDLHEIDDGVVVIRLHDVNVFGLDAGQRIEFGAVFGPAAAILDGVFLPGIVAFNGGQNAHVGQAQVLGTAFVHDQEGIGACARHDAVKQVDGVGNDARVHVLLQRQRLFHEGIGVAQRVGALVDAHFAEVFTGGPVVVHVVACQQGEAGIRATCPVGVGAVLRKAREAADRVAE